MTLEPENRKSQFKVGEMVQVTCTLTGRIDCLGRQRQGDEFSSYYSIILDVGDTLHEVPEDKIEPGEE